MGRVALLVDKSELQAQLDKAEAEHTFTNRSKLYTHVSNTEWAKAIKDALGRTRGLSPMVIYQRVNEFKIQIKTPMGKRGNPTIGKRLTKEERKAKIEKRPGYIQGMQRLTYDANNHFGKRKDSIANLINKLRNGSKTAAIKLKCLECCCWSATEASRCTVYGCPLYMLNPFIGSSSVEEVVDKDDE
jgi:hypothetical protein